MRICEKAHFSFARENDKDDSFRASLSLPHPSPYAFHYHKAENFPMKFSFAVEMLARKNVTEVSGLLK